MWVILMIETDLEGLTESYEKKFDQSVSNLWGFGHPLRVLDVLGFYKKNDDDKVYVNKNFPDRSFLFKENSNIYLFPGEKCYSLVCEGELK